MTALVPQVDLEGTGWRQGTSLHGLSEPGVVDPAVPLYAGAGPGKGTAGRPLPVRTAGLLLSGPGQPVGQAGLQPYRVPQGQLAKDQCGTLPFAKITGSGKRPHIAWRPALAGKKALRSVLPSAICSALRRSGETGRRTGLKIQRGRPHVGSIPTSGTSKFKG